MSAVGVKPDFVKQNEMDGGAKSFCERRLTEQLALRSRRSTSQIT
jgi:hypothetical protein